MPYSLGVDLGASFTAVAIADELGTHVAQLSPLLAVPSAVYVSPDGSLITGEQALRAGEGDPSRLVRNFKKRLGDPTPLVVSGMQYTPEQLMAAQLRDVVAEVAGLRGEPAGAIVLTHPVTWGPYRTEHFARIAELSGVDVRRTITEPVATATHLQAQRGVKDADILAIVDFGSEAVTVTLLRKGIDGFDILGTPEDVDHVGSAYFDDAMRTLLDQKLGGMISALDPTAPADAAMLTAIESTCSDAKESLSSRKEAAVSVALPTGVRQLTVTRDEFDRLIRPSVRLAVDALRRTISSAELDESAIASVVLTGGASRIPLVADAFADLGRPVHAIHHPKLMVALGAAHAARMLAIEAEPGLAAADGAVPASARSTGRSMRPLSKRVLIGIAVAGVLVLAGIAAAIIIPQLGSPMTSLSPVGSSADDQQTTSPEPEVISPEATEIPAAIPTPTKTFPVFENGETAPGMQWYIAAAGDADQWGVASLHDGVAEMPGIALAATEGVLRAEWSSPNWLSQFYVQLENEVLDLQEIATEDGALVFDLTVLSGSPQVLQVAAHCVFPCAGAVDITDAVTGLAPNTPAQVIVPAECLTGAGLDITRINTPFLLIGQGDFALTVGNIRWENLSGSRPDVMTC